MKYIPSYGCRWPTKSMACVEFVWDGPCGLPNTQTIYNYQPISTWKEVIQLNPTKMHQSDKGWHWYGIGILHYMYTGINFPATAAIEFAVLLNSMIFQRRLSQGAAWVRYLIAMK